MASQTLDSQSPSSPTVEDPIPRDPDPREVLDDVRRRAILAIISAGNSRRTAARCIGCAPSTITRTAERDPEFAEQLAAALHSVDRKCLSLLWSAAQSGQWRAAAWLLERTNPDDFAKRPPNTFTPDDVTSMFLQFVAALSLDRSPEDQDRLRQSANQWLEENLDADLPAAQPPKENPAEDQPDRSSLCPSNPLAQGTARPAAATQPLPRSQNPDMHTNSPTAVASETDASPAAPSAQPASPETPPRIVTPNLCNTPLSTDPQPRPNPSP